MASLGPMLSRAAPRQAGDTTWLGHPTPGWGHHPEARPPPRLGHLPPGASPCQEPLLTCAQSSAEIERLPRGQPQHALSSPFPECALREGPQRSTCWSARWEAAHHGVILPGLEWTWGCRRGCFGTPHALQNPGPGGHLGPGLGTPLP